MPWERSPTRSTETHRASRWTTRWSSTHLRECEQSQSAVHHQQQQPSGTQINIRHAGEQPSGQQRIRQFQLRRQQRHRVNLMAFPGRRRRAWRTAIRTMVSRSSPGGANWSRQRRATQLDCRRAGTSSMGRHRRWSDTNNWSGLNVTGGNSCRRRTAGLAWAAISRFMGWASRRVARLRPPTFKFRAMSRRASRVAAPPFPPRSLDAGLHLQRQRPGPGWSLGTAARCQLPGTATATATNNLRERRVEHHGHGALHRRYRHRHLRRPVSQPQ